MQFEIDADGLLSVLARDIATGRDTKVKMQSAVEVSDEAVEKMLSDSLEHAFEDMDRARVCRGVFEGGRDVASCRDGAPAAGRRSPPEEREDNFGLVRQMLEARESVHFRI